MVDAYSEGRAQPGQGKVHRESPLYQKSAANTLIHILLFANFASSMRNPSDSNMRRGVSNLHDKDKLPPTNVISLEKLEEPYREVTRYLAENRELRAASIDALTLSLLKATTVTQRRSLAARWG